MTNIALTLYNNVAKFFLAYYLFFVYDYKYLIMCDAKKILWSPKQIVDDILIVLFTLFHSKVHEST